MALRNNITSLLGKRQYSKGDSEEGNSRAGKRARPQRSKVQSRQPSDAQLSEPVPVPTPVPAPSFGGSMNPFESYDDDLNLLDKSHLGEESMRVTYVDPRQRDEKKRLMSLLKTESTLEGGVGKVSSTRTRKSARIAGF